MSLPVSADSNGDFKTEFSLENDALEWIEMANITIADPSTPSFAKMRIEGNHVVAARVTVNTSDGFPITCPGMPGEYGEARWFDGQAGDSEAGHHNQPIPVEALSDGQFTLTLTAGESSSINTILWLNCGGVTSFTVEIYGEKPGAGLVRGALNANSRANGWT